MTAVHAPNVTDKFATRLIRRTAKELVGGGVFPQSDLEDVIQELQLALIAQAANFDPNRARWSTFVKNVIERSAISLRRRQNAQCRQPASEVSSLNVLIEDGEGQLVELGATVSEEEHRTSVGQGFISHTDEVRAAIDVQGVLESLPEDLQDICQRLKSKSPNEVARDLGISRPTMHRRVKVLQERFRSAGVGNAFAQDQSLTDILLRESPEVYHAKAGEYLSSHLLADFRRCPQLYFRKRCGLVPHEDRPAYLLGRAAHVLVLEGKEAFQAAFAVGGPINPKTGQPFGPTTKAFAEWAKTRQKEVLTVEQYALVEQMADSVGRHKIAGDLLSDGVAEGVLRNAYCDLPCQIRIDWFAPEKAVCDLKTVDSMDYFEADARRYGYCHQLAFYIAVLRERIGVEMPAFFVAVEKREPFRTGVWRVDEEVVRAAIRENEAAIGRLRKCEASGEWPTGYEEQRVFDYF
jgi:RNA polymerase sigma-70 factor (ECF subfamily)